MLSPQEVLRRHGLSARKSWGQHFLSDANVLRAIARASDAGPSDRIVEIGAGLGTLTQYLLETGADVWAIERDRDLCEVLRGELGQRPNFTLHEADAVRFDYGSAAADRGERRPIIVGNLPYHLTGPLLFRLLEFHEHTGPWIVMIQKEVADRILAPPGNKTYGSMTIALGRLRSVRKVAAVPPGAFLPPPKVDSSVIALDPRPEPLGAPVDGDAFMHLVRTTFQQRRKTLANAMSSFADRATLQHWCEVAGIDPQLRPERLSIEQFVALQRARQGHA